MDALWAMSDDTLEVLISIMCYEPKGLSMWTTYMYRLHSMMLSHVIINKTGIRRDLVLILFIVGITLLNRLSLKSDVISPKQCQ